MVSVHFDLNLIAGLDGDKPARMSKELHKLFKELICIFENRGVGKQMLKLLTFPNPKYWPNAQSEQQTYKYVSGINTE